MSKIGPKFLIIRKSKILLQGLWLYKHSSFDPPNFFLIDYLLVWIVITKSRNSCKIFWYPMTLFFIYLKNLLLNHEFSIYFQ